VYPVFILEDGRGATTGAVAFFVEDLARGAEDHTKSPADIAVMAEPLFVGNIESTGILMFSEACTGLGGRDVIVDCEVPPGKYELIAWLGVVPTLLPGGMEPFVRPIALAAYGSDLLQALERVAPPDRNPRSVETFQPWNTMEWGVLGHREPRWGEAAMNNFREDVARGASDRATSWLLQAAAHDDQDALVQVSEILNSTDPELAGERRRLLALRGQSET
jgi:hypothetical protein